MDGNRGEDGRSASAAQWAMQEASAAFLECDGQQSGLPAGSGMDMRDEADDALSAMAAGLIHALKA
jgi:hypothetical protein